MVLSAFADTFVDCPADVRPGFVYHTSNVIAFHVQDGNNSDVESIVFADDYVKKHPFVALFRPTTKGKAMVMTRFNIYKVGYLAAPL